MKYLISLAILISLVSLSEVSFANQDLLNYEVIDGNTISLNGEIIKIRGIDAPELDQPYGEKTKSVLENIFLRFEPEFKNMTRPRQNVRYADLIINEDGEVLSVGEMLISLGLAWSTDKEWLKPTSNQKLMAEAKRHKKNLWSDPNPINPDSWRRNPARYKINLGPIVQARYDEEQRRLAVQAMRLAELRSQNLRLASEQRETNEKRLALTQEDIAYSNIYNKMNELSIYDQVIQLSEGELFTGMSNIDDVRKMLK